MSNTTFIIWKGEKGNSRASGKSNAVRILLYLMEDAGGTKVKNGEFFYLATVKDRPPSDAMRALVKDGDIVGVSTIPADMRKRASVLKERYDGMRNGKNLIGPDFLRYWLDRFYMTYDMWGDTDAKE